MRDLLRVVSAMIDRGITNASTCLWDPSPFTTPDVLPDDVHFCLCATPHTRQQADVHRECTKKAF